MVRIPQNSKLHEQLTDPPNSSVARSAKMANNPPYVNMLIINPTVVVSQLKSACYKYQVIAKSFFKLVILMFMTLFINEAAVLTFTSVVFPSTYDLLDTISVTAMLMLLRNIWMFMKHKNSTIATKNLFENNNDGVSSIICDVVSLYLNRGRKVRSSIQMKK